MPNERIILCGNASHGKLPFEDTQPIHLRLWGTNKNITLRIDDITKSMLKNIPPQFSDLIDIATYIYCADQAVTRGGGGVDNFGENWRRKLFFRIPVRQPDLWNSPDLLEKLCSTLGFLSEDEYFFEFIKLEKAPLLQQYLGFSDVNTLLGHPEEVMLFSGGLDSLSGAIQESIVNRRKIALVTHKPTPKIGKRLRYLKESLAQNPKGIPPLHIPVSINKGKALSREYTQRSRSFLYAALAATIAQMLGLSHIKFYENGVVSFNLPVSAQVVGARATRTTHPQVIKGFSSILSAVADRKFTVENPFLWKTKTEIIELIAEAGCSELIKYSTSCTHTWEMTKLRTHCGTCSQCIDRRFAVLAAGLESADPMEAYKVDLLVGERDLGEPRTMLSSYVETASEMSRMSPVEFFSRYGEASRLLRHLDGSADSAALRLFELHQKHAGYVTKVVDNAIAKHASDIRERKLPSSCLLRLVCDSTFPPEISDTRLKSANENSIALEDNVFRRKGQVWTVRFAGGKKIILLPSKGTAYLHILLSHPRTTFSLTDIVFRVIKEPDRFILGDAGVGSDKQALAAYRTRYKDLEDELEKAENNNDLGQQERIGNERDWLMQQIKHDQGLGGRLREEASDRDRIRKAFRAAIRRAVEEIAKYDRRLADHLKSPHITCGWNPCYNPSEEIEWNT